MHNIPVLVAYRLIWLIVSFKNLFEVHLAKYINKQRLILEYNQSIEMGGLSVKSKETPFLWHFMERPLPRPKIDGYYDEENDLNMTRIEGRSVPVVLVERFLVETQTKTMVEKEKDDTD